MTLYGYEKNNPMLRPLGEAYQPNLADHKSIMCSEPISFPESNYDTDFLNPYFCVDTVDATDANVDELPVVDEGFEKVKDAFIRDILGL